MKNKNVLSIITLLFCFIFTNCSFFTSLGETFTQDYNAKVTAVTFDYTTLNVDIGSSEYLKVTLSGSEQNKCNVYWEFDKEMIEIVTDKYGAIITGLKAGGTYVKASCNGIIATCLISVISTGDDLSIGSYIYSNDAVVQLKPGNTQIVSVGLYGGSTADMEDFTWSIDDSSIANISYSRNNCVINAKKTGHTRITASHPKSKYDYTFVVYVYQDSFDVTYITTSQNVLCLDKNSSDSSGKTITVNLINPISLNYQSGFSWNYADEESKNIIQIDANNDTCLVIPKSNGVAKINVTHTNAQETLSIIVRVTTIVQNTYISLSPSTLIVKGSDDWFSSIATVENYDGYVNPDKFVWGFTNEFGQFVEEFPSSVTDLCDITTSGNKLQILGKKNGSFKVTVSHEIAEFKRNVLVILTEQIGSAIDASMYITTSDNYVITQNGADETTVTVSLMGGKQGEEKDFEWYIDGENITWENEYNNNIAEVMYADGKVLHGSPAPRAAVFTDSVKGILTINPKYTSTPGTFNITIRHPRCLYDCNITIKVYSKYALLKDPINISLDGNSPLKIINGQTQSLNASLTNASYGGENSITWESSNSSKVSVSPTIGSTSVINACGSGNGQTYLTLNYDTEGEKAYSPFKRLVLTADSYEDFENMKYISSTTQYIRLQQGSSDIEATVDCGGKITSSDRIKWETSNANIICPVSSSTEVIEGKSTTKLRGITEGNATITATIQGDSSSEPVTFNIVVVPQGESTEVISPPMYLTTQKNAIVIENTGESYQERLSVTGVNISSENMISTQWNMEDTDTEDGDFSSQNFTLCPNGDNATIWANKKGKSVITVSNPSSSNDIKINAKCGSILEWTDGYVCYITTENDVFNFSKDDKTKTIGAALENVTSTTQGWTWKVTQGTNIVSIANYTAAPNVTSTCTLNILEAGQAMITIYNNEAVAEKEIIINVANSKEELSSLVYLTTTTNVVAVGEGASKTVSVSIENSKTNILSGFSWDVISGSDIIDVVASGSTAVFFGKKCGTAKIRVTNPAVCTYPLEIIANVVDPLAIKDDPYIACQNIVTVSVGGSNASLSAELVGGTEADKANFSWTIENNSIATLYASNSNAEIKGLKEGTTQVTISHPKSSYKRTILVIVEAKTVSSCYIQLSQGIVQATPGGDAITIDANLINGLPEDNYRFKWWASNYDKINIEYTGKSCVVTPLTSGNVTIYCSHPKAADDATSIIRISNYKLFAFEQPRIEVEANSVTYINLDTPAEFLESGYFVDYQSNNSVCIAQMPGGSSTSVCLLQTNSTNAPTTATIKANLKDKAGTIKATAELLVYVKPTVINKAYMTIENNKQTITLEKGSLNSFTVNLHNTDSKSLSFMIGNKSDTNNYTSSYHYQNELLEVTRNSSNPNVFQIKAKTSGATTISIKNDDCTYPITVYVYIPGTDDPSITLNYDKCPIFLGDKATTITATIKNSTATPVWTLKSEDGQPVENRTYFDLLTKDTKAMVTPISLGSAYLTATITENGIEYSDSCLVSVREVAHLNLYTFLNEETMNTKIPVKNMFVYPGETKLLHYDSVDADGNFENIRQLELTTSKYVEVTDLGNKGLTYKGITYPEGIGTILLQGQKESTEPVKMTVTSMSNVKSVVTIESSYKNHFSVNNTLLTEYIEPGNTDIGALEKYVIDYELRPALSFIRVLIPNEMNKYVHPIGIGNPITTYKNEIESSIYTLYEFEPSKLNDTEYDVDEGIIKGKLRFYVEGEFYAPLDNNNQKRKVILEAVNRNVLQTSSDLTEAITVGSKQINMSYTYKNYDFEITNEGNYPYSKTNNNNYTQKKDYGYSTVTSGGLILGDGEAATFKIKYKNAPLANAKISLNYTSRKDSNGKTIAVLGNPISNNDKMGEGYGLIKLYHELDYGWNSGNTSKIFYDMNTPTDAIVECVNTTVRKIEEIGKITITVQNGDINQPVYSIPVYLQIRNSPCMIINGVYDEAGTTVYTEKSWKELQDKASSN